MKIIKKLVYILLASSFSLLSMTQLEALSEDQIVSVAKTADSADKVTYTAYLNNGDILECSIFPGVGEDKFLYKVSSQSRIKSYNVKERCKESEFNFLEELYKKRKNVLGKEESLE